MTRLLPRTEWARLDATDTADLWRQIAPERLRVLAVEDVATGELLGVLLLITVEHAEGCWIDPAHRRSAAVGRALLSGLRAELARTQTRGVWAGSLSEDMREILEGLQAQPVPGEHFIVSGDDLPCRQQ